MESTYQALSLGLSRIRSSETFAPSLSYLPPAIHNVVPDWVDIHLPHM